jgi:outer membrane biosynthesis protein TonB
MKRIALFIILTFILCLIVVLVAPDLFKLTRESSIPVLLGESEGSGVSEDALVQKIRDEVVFKGLSEMALREEHQPPLPQGSLLPTEKLEEQEKMRILENSSFYHELGKIVQEGERKREFFNVPRPKTNDVKGADVPLPEDAVAQQFIASLREHTKEHEGMQQNNPGDAALDIRGPAANRKVNYIPPSLQSKPSVHGDVLLKFWVLPDGTVGKVIPLVTEGARVYLAAINHIKQYRFEPLPKDSPQIETWGVIPVQSVLR